MVALSRSDSHACGRLLVPLSNQVVCLQDKGEEEEEEEEGGEEGQEQQQQQQHRQQKNTKMKYVSLQVWGLPYELPPKSFSDPFLGVGLSAWLVSTRQVSQ